MYKFKIINFKNLILPFTLVLFTLCLVLFSNSNLLYAKNGLTLWANSIVPSLFPFFVATELLSYTNFTYYLGKLLNRIMKPCFNIRGEGSFAFIMGILSGYPIGAKIAANFRKNNVCSKVECERLLSFTNNSGPLFIIGSVGISLFGNSTIGFLLLFTHLLASISVVLVPIYGSVTIISGFVVVTFCSVLFFEFPALSYANIYNVYSVSSNPVMV